MKIDRRAYLGGVAGVASLLAGCSTGGGGQPPSTVTPAPVPAVGPDPVAVAGELDPATVGDAHVDALAGVSANVAVDYTAGRRDQPFELARILATVDGVRNPRAQVQRGHPGLQRPMIRGRRGGRPFRGREHPVGPSRARRPHAAVAQRPGRPRPARGPALGLPAVGDRRRGRQRGDRGVGGRPCPTPHAARSARRRRRRRYWRPSSRCHRAGPAATRPPLPTVWR